MRHKENFKSFIFALFLILLVTSGHASQNYREIYPSFDLSLSRYGRSARLYDIYYNWMPANQLNPPYLAQKEVWKALYQQECERSIPLDNEHIIPRVIHQIWLGSPVPEEYQKWMQSWVNWNGWEYCLWTDKEVENLTLYNADFYKKATNFGEKSDILRYEILNQFGGLYVDTDFACLNPDFFDFLHRNYTFYVGIEPLENDALRCCNALIGASPGHPLMNKLVEEVASDYKKKKQYSIVLKTGPGFLSRILAKYPDLLKGGMIFPPTFFYPAVRAELMHGVDCCEQESAAIHFWEGSWAFMPLKKDQI